MDGEDSVRRERTVTMFKRGQPWAADVRKGLLPRLERSKEGDDILLLFCVQAKLQHKVEILHRIFEREAAPIMQVGGLTFIIPALRTWLILVGTRCASGHT